MNQPVQASDDPERGVSSVDQPTTGPGEVWPLSKLFIGLSLVPYLGLFTGLFVAWRIVGKGWESVSKNLKLFCFIAGAAWLAWALAYVGYYATSPAEPVGYLKTLAGLAVAAQTPTVLILVGYYYLHARIRPNL